MGQKILGGLLLGSVVPGALIAGIVWTALEGLPLGSGIDAVGTAPERHEQPDLAPEPGDFGTVVHPKDVTLTDPAGAKFVKWAAEPNIDVELLVPSGNNLEAYQRVIRKYSFIVDREERLLGDDRPVQIWWPSDDGKSGYRGRWGPFVTDDVHLRRAGMWFPEFWRMFFVALAKSDY